MKMTVFKSAFSAEIVNYLYYRISCGIDIKSEFQYYRKLDDFLLSEHMTNISFTREQAVLWCSPLFNESESGRYKRINHTKKFFEFLFKKGYSVFQFKDIKAHRKDFVPHIYTEEEIESYFTAVDTHQSIINKKNNVQFPVLFRILYCCGTRITETLMIKKRDVDLTEGTIKLSETKNQKHRYVVMSESLLVLMKQYADKIFYMLSDNDYIFRNGYGKYFSSDWIHELHVKILRKAGIPYLGGGIGPRIHDWRHTFAIYSFKRMIDDGMDMYVALPVLSTYLGHKSIMATERYLRLTISMYPYIEKKFSKTAEDVFGEGLL